MDILINRRHSSISTVNFQVATATKALSCCESIFSVIDGSHQPTKCRPDWQESWFMWEVLTDYQVLSWFIKICTTAIHSSCRSCQNHAMCSGKLVWVKHGRGANEPRNAQVAIWRCFSCRKPRTTWAQRKGWQRPNHGFGPWTGGCWWWTKSTPPNTQTRHEFYIIFILYFTIFSSLRLMHVSFSPGGCSGIKRGKSQSFPQSSPSC